MFFLTIVLNLFASVLIWVVAFFLSFLIFGKSASGLDIFSLIGVGIYLLIWGGVIAGMVMGERRFWKEKIQNISDRNLVSLELIFLVLGMLIPIISLELIFFIIIIYWIVPISILATLVKSDSKYWTIFVWHFFVSILSFLLLSLFLLPNLVL